MQPTPIAEPKPERNATAVQIAFHTPLNAFDDGGISGDRRMARQLAAGLEQLGHMIAPVLDARSYMKTPDMFERLRTEAMARIAPLLAQWHEAGTMPDLWFTYHSYYKAPDLLGPPIAARLGIPYIVAEASDSRRRAGGEWAANVALARASFGAADLHLCFTAQDRRSLAPWLGPQAQTLAFSPFIAAGSPPRAITESAAAPRLVTVAMMRGGVKHQSYLALARALQRLADRPWTLTVIGDGPLRDEVVQAFTSLPPGRVSWRGALAHDAVAAELAGHDIFVWPGLGEAYGLVYLEAQAAGLPVVAFDSGGVPETVKVGETALLAPAHDDAALAGALARLLDDPDLRARMGRAATAFVTRERTMDAACAILARALELAVQIRRTRQDAAS